MGSAARIATAIAFSTISTIAACAVSLNRENARAAFNSEPGKGKENTSMSELSDKRNRVGVLALALGVAATVALLPTNAAAQNGPPAPAPKGRQSKPVFVTNGADQAIPVRTDGTTTVEGHVVIDGVPTVDLGAGSSVGINGEVTVTTPPDQELPVAVNQALIAPGASNRAIPGAFWTAPRPAYTSFAYLSDVDEGDEAFYDGGNVVLSSLTVFSPDDTISVRLFGPYPVLETNGCLGDACRKVFPDPEARRAQFAVFVSKSVQTFTFPSPITVRFIRVSCNNPPLIPCNDNAIFGLGSMAGE